MLKKFAEFAPRFVKNVGMNVPNITTSIAANVRKSVTSVPKNAEV